MTTAAEFANRCVEALNLCEEALYTDGSHHKQWYLEQIARTLLGADETNPGEAWEAWKAQAAGDPEDEEHYYGEWEEGIAP